MKKYKVTVLNIANAEVKEARSWYELQRKGLGKRFNMELRNALSAIAQNPTLYAIRYGQNRKVNLAKFPYGVFFIIDDQNDEVFIVAVKHNARNMPA